MGVRSLPTRNELDPAETWALEHVFSSPTEYESELGRLGAEVARLAGYRGRLGDDPGTLLAALELLSELTASTARLRIYAVLPSAADGGDGDARRAAARFEALASRWESDTAFLRPELLALPPERLAAFRAREPRLERFAAYLERLERDRPHVRSSEVEDVLALVRQPFASAYRARHALTTTGMRFGSVDDAGSEREVAPSTERSLAGSSDREVRRQAFVSFADGFLALQDTLAELLLGRVEQQAFEARVRRHAAGEAAALADMHVDRRVLDATLEVFTRRIGTWHRYWRVRRDLLGVDRLEPWDVLAPLARRPPEVGIERARGWIVDSAEPLGEAYARRLDAGLGAERWVDLRPNRGKREGAFCDAAPGVHPFILMSYVDDLPSASTLAHELGHAMHAELAYAEQDVLDVEALGMTVAETASNAQQALLRSHLLRGPARDDPELEVAVLDEAMGNFHRYFFVMPTLVRFERWLHAAIWEGEALTGSDLTASLQRLFQEGYGETIEADERTGVAWAQFAHLYVPFYTFQYAVGIAAATALVGRIEDGAPDGAEALLRFMRAGAAVPPIDLFASVGLDVSTTEPVDRAFDVLDRYVGRLEALSG